MRPITSKDLARVAPGGLKQDPVFDHQRGLDGISTGESPGYRQRSGILDFDLLFDFDHTTYPLDLERSQLAALELGLPGMLGDQHGDRSIEPFLGIRIWLQRRAA